MHQSFKKELCVDRGHDDHKASRVPCVCVCVRMLTLKHFVLKSEGRKLYRDVLRALKGVDEGTAAGIRQAAREQFSDHANETDVNREHFAHRMCCIILPGDIA